MVSLKPKGSPPARAAGIMLYITEWQLETDKNSEHTEGDLNAAQRDLREMRHMTFPSDNSVRKLQDMVVLERTGSSSGGV